jgi:YebC/PmpR family DNA-binding regulatory protein
VFSKLAKEIMVAARIGGGDPASNITLRTIIQKARAVNMPTDNIDRAVKKGTGELGGAAVEEIIYEGFAPGGISIVVQVLSDNRNRTTAEVRHVFTRFNGNLASQGSVMRTFRRKGYISIPAQAVDEDRLLEVVLDAGAEDVSRVGEYYEVLTDPAQFPAVTEALAAAGIKSESAEVALIPDTEIPVTGREQAGHLLKFIEALEELDDVQNVYANFDVDESLLEALSKA